MEWYEAAFDRYYPILYSHRDDAEAEAALSAYGHFLNGHEPVLDLASGAGRYLQALRREGHDAYGLDLSAYLLRQSVEKEHLGDRVLQGDMRSLPFRSGAFGAVINMFTSFGYFASDTENLRVLQEVHRVLRRGGVFVLDFINAETVPDSLEPHSQRCSRGFDIDERRDIVESGRYLVKSVTITDRTTRESESFEERLRLYNPGDLIGMLESTGMNVIDRFGDYHGNPFVPAQSDRIVIVSEKG